ncbi:MAG: hypothetical protein AAGD38_01510 [Acidobacteriota bacterium]
MTFGCTPKREVEQYIHLGIKFNEPPTVVVTPEWRGSNRNVGHAETIDTIADDHFYVASNNAASSGYFVNWIAIGNADGRSGIPREIRSDDMLLERGRFDKAVVQPRAVRFGSFFPSASGLRLPSIQLSPHWRRQHQGVGGEETITRSGGAMFFAESGNAAPNFGVNWLAIGSQSGTRTSFELPNDRLLQIGIANKTTAATRVTFPQPFRETAAVVATPAWSRPVGHAETLSGFDRDGFDLISGNAAPDYQVHWIAVGRRV